MRFSQAKLTRDPAAYRPNPEALRRVHGLRRHKGRIAAIEPRSGEYFIADSTMAALDLARAAQPDAIFYIVRIGHKTAHVHRTPNRRIGR